MSKDENYIVYTKDGREIREEAPKYGEITLVYQDGKMVYLKRTETKK